jgi:hypothetical protein
VSVVEKGDWKVKPHAVRNGDFIGPDKDYEGKKSGPKKVL